MKSKLKYGLLSLTLLLLTACGGADTISTDNTTQTSQSTEAETNNSTILLSDGDMKKIEETVSNMTLEQKVGQMFIVTPEAFSASGNVTEYKQIKMEEVLKYNVGGFIMFAQNLTSPSQIITLNESLKNTESDIPFFIMIDEEGGEISRISSNANFPDASVEYMSEIGKRNDPSEALAIGEHIGGYLSKYGFNVNLSPDCDVLSNTENAVVTNRSFSSDPNVVASMTTNVLAGLHSNGVLGSAKHFPGHGNTDSETYEGFAVSHATLDEMRERELVPFQAMIDNGVDFVMVGHVVYPEASDNLVPATLNYDVTTELLRNEMGFEGVAISDAMSMGAIVNNYELSESVVGAINAGIDVILMPSNFVRSYQIIIDAVNSGEISMERIDEAVTRVLVAKAKMAI